MISVPYSRNGEPENSEEQYHVPAAANLPVSGVYSWSLSGNQSVSRATLRLDVDGMTPLNVASGTEFGGLTQKVDWVARPMVAKVGLDGQSWSGPVTYRNGDSFLFQFTTIRIERNGQLMRVTFQGGGPDLTRDYFFNSASFRPVEFEYDAEEGITPITSIGTHNHPHRPGSLPKENLSIESIFKRAGFDVKVSQRGTVPLAGANTNKMWSDAEMHDAMRVYWSRFADRPQWSMWTLFAGLHEQGDSLGGIMFDDIGPQHRQGTAIFTKSFIAQAPSNDPAPDAWIQRMVFWTAVHEMGHSFNLAHAWQKNSGIPWMPMSNGYNSMTFMNYPFLYGTGSFSNANTINFFREFGFRFSDEELLFLRHAPERFVQMGNASWFDSHGFEQAAVSPDPQLKLTARINRNSNEFEFLEPVVIELKLTNVTSDPCLVPDSVLRFHDLMKVVIKRNSDPAREWDPYAHHCWISRNKVLSPGESVYESLFLSAGHHGWLIAEPGLYQIQVGLQLNGEDIISNTLTIRVAPPRNYEEAYVAQDYFSDDVGRVLSFDGSQEMSSANDTLHLIKDRFAESRAGIHAAIALGAPRARSFKRYDPVRIEELPAETEAINMLKVALGTSKESAQRAADTLGNIDYRYYSECYSDAQAKKGEEQEAQAGLQLLHKTLQERQVLPRVLKEVSDKQVADAALVNRRRTKK